MTRVDHEKLRRREGHAPYEHVPRPKLITARFATSCRVCSGYIQPGEDAWWLKGVIGLVHSACQQIRSQPGADRSAREEFSLRKRSGLTDPKAHAYVERVKARQRDAEERWRKYGHSA